MSPEASALQADSLPRFTGEDLTYVLMSSKMVLF